MAESRIGVVYADDEPIARRGLDRLLGGESDVEVLGACENGLDALEAIRVRRPDVALLDVSMPGMSGVEVVRALTSSERPAIVFVTAFDRFAIEAFDLHAVDYLLKPFDEERFRVAFQRVRERLRAARAGDHVLELDALLDALERRSPAANRLAVKDGDTVRLIPTAEIVWCQSEDNYVRIHASGRRYLVRMTMRALTDKLDPRQFARIHRSFIVNLARVQELRPTATGDYRVLLDDGTKLTMSRSHRAAVLGKVQI